MYKKKRLVSFGRLSSNLCNSFNIKSEVYAADFNWDLVLKIVQLDKINYQEISKFPKVRRDLSLLIDKSVSFDDLHNLAMKVDNKILRSVNLFDVYEGEELPEGKKSYALSFNMVDDTQTLTDKYVDKLMERLINSFKDQVGAEVR
tara:strand:- start:949 stop:1386 length:438 start_codon:yes stop_codon:yes gene_type:complete